MNVQAPSYTFSPIKPNPLIGSNSTAFQVAGATYRKFQSPKDPKGKGKRTALSKLLDAIDDETQGIPESDSGKPNSEYIKPSSL
jgi:hypothetical protein